MAEFIWPAKKVYTKIIKYPTLITTFESGKEQRRNKGEPRRRWILGFMKEETDADNIWQFYNDRKGEFEAFDWITPEGELVRARFANEFEMTDQYRLQFDFTLEFIEVL